MIKSDLVDKIAEKTGFTKKDSEKALDAVTDSIVEAAVSGEKVQLVGFGAFEVRRREERVGRDPRTGEPITIPASNTLAFKAGKTAKDAVNNK